MADLNPAIEKYRAKDTVFTPSNIISAMRIVLVFPAIFAIVSHLYVMAAAIFVAAFISDLLDGFVARKLDAVSEIGKIIDPLADKIFVGLVVITMAIYNLVPIWFLTVILVRDVVILIGGIWAKRRLGVILPSNYPGKIAVVFISITLFLCILQVSVSLVQVFEFLSLALMILSLVVYGQRLASLLRTV
jgi:CDP-diacylglycerol--glycerol-3-phosphate 3-phosphatidyltransferase